MTKKKQKIFLSYVHEDIGMAKKIYQDLKRYGLDVWFDNESLLPGQDWEKEITKAIRECDYFIGLLSDKCLSKRGFAHSELKFSYKILEQYFPSETGIFILPVRLDKCKPSDAYERLGRLHWIDVFPKSEYQNGLKKILQVVSPGTLILRSTPMELSNKDVHDLIRKHNFFDWAKNLLSKGFPNEYIEINITGDKLVFDEFSCLMWQQSGSENAMKYEKAEKWIIELNQRNFAGFNDWRLPTLEEAMSLMEPEQKNGLYIDPIFDSKQEWIWTADQVQGESRAVWVVTFDDGSCYWSDVDNGRSVRAVRSCIGNSKL